jgi:1-deoxy-D-xylulose-5-phosphate reductoisomerase
VYSGEKGLVEIAVIDGADTVVTSIVGIAGLVPTIAAIRAGKDIALANKETLVTAGHIVMSEAEKHNVRIIPVDSEHSAIFQCLLENNRSELSKIILTASGGPFRGRKLADLEKVTCEDALKHPNWSMGNKITIDSATLMNKGLEVIEAKWLFNVEPDRIQVVVHPQSAIHSAVEYQDGTIIAQMGAPDMRIPIQFALTYPKRAQNSFSRLNLFETSSLTFEKPDMDTFKCLEFAFRAIREGGTMPAVMNAANEVAVSLFLKKKAGFLDIQNTIEKVMERHNPISNPTLSDILEADKWARECVETM